MTSSPSAPAVRIAGLQKWYGSFQVLHDIDLTVQANERIVICGPSGSGKSTLIRCINQLETHDRGTIEVNGQPVGRSTPRMHLVCRLLLENKKQIDTFTPPAEVDICN